MRIKNTKDITTIYYEIYTIHLFDIITNSIIKFTYWFLYATKNNHNNFSHNCYG